MSLMDRLFNGVEMYIHRRNTDQMTSRFGGVQRCPWCRQWAQSVDGWNFRASEVEPMHDVLTCGVCGGTSLWHFAMGMHYIRPIDPPNPADWAPEVRM